jgi:phosphoglycolate phosphatase-like HAD superfamily hydrolase
MMTIKALLFGSIGTLVEMSDLQRRAFNQTFFEAGLDWDWNVQLYERLLTKSGGRERIKDYAVEHGISVDATQLHARKTEIFSALMAEESMSLRSGVASVIDHAIVKWSCKSGQRAKMYPTRTNGYENDETTELFRQIQGYSSA